MYRSLLVPLDGSAFAEQALPVALRIAQRAGASVQVVTVAAHPGLLSRQSASQMASSWRDYVSGVVEPDQCASRVPVSTLVLEGADVAATLCMHANETSVDLVVMSTHGRGTLGCLWFGSVAYEVVHRLSMPVLFVRPCRSTERYQGTALQHMLIPLDGSLPAERVLEPALSFGALMEADYTLMRDIPDVSIVGARELDRVSLLSPALELLDEVRSVQDRLNKEAQDYLDGVAVRLRARGLQVHTQVVVACDPASAILDALAATRIDLVALETPAHGPTDRHVGSVARKVIHGTNKPVFIHSAVATAPGELATR